MLFQELLDVLENDNEDQVRAFLGSIDLPINPKARIIPDQHIDTIIDLYKKSDIANKKHEQVIIPTSSKHEDAVIIGREEPIHHKPTVDDLFSFRKPPETFDEEQRSQDKLKKFHHTNKKETEDTRAKKRVETIIKKPEVQNHMRDLSSIRFDDFTLDIDAHENEVLVGEEDEKEDSIALAVERAERERERELEKLSKPKVHKEEIKEEEIEEEIDEETMAEREKQRKGENLIQKEIATVGETTTVKEFAEKIGIPPAKVIKALLKNGVIVTINHKIDFDTAALIGDELGVKIQKEQSTFSSEDLLMGNLTKLLENEEPELQVERAPIVSIMGHVDHGKTSLLDYIRKSKITAGEAGGITQAIGAYQVEIKEKKITFLDTPGHEAFTAMRARGAKATDIAILVVAADESVKPQTIEAINHAKEAGIPVIVALNKIDKEGTNIDRVKAEISEYGLVPDDWGGDTIMVPVSALTGQGVDQLLDMVLLVAEMQNLKANPNRDALGTIIESHLDSSLGPVATVLINTGTLHLGDNFVVGDTFGRIKIMTDAKGKKVKDALPSMPVRIAGMSVTPQTGDILQVLPTEKAAREKALEIEAIRKSAAYTSGSGHAFNDLIARISKGDLKKLKIVLKADTVGSLEAIRTALLKKNTEEVEVSIIHSGVGNITETDVLMGSASDGLIIGFNVETLPQVDKAAEKMHVTIKKYRVIYHLIDEIHKLLQGLLDPEIVETVLGDFTVMQIFFANRKYQIIGGRVSKGKIINKGKIRVIRGDKLVGEGVIDTLQKGTENVQEVTEGHECGIKFIGKCEPEVKDIFEIYTIEHITRTLA